MDFNITRATSGEVVDSVNDLLIQILINLPVKSLMRFKLVSKHWKSLITSRQFALVRHPGPNPAVGLVCPGRRSPKYEYLHLDLTKKTKLPFRELSFPWEDVSCWVHQSCNGLLLCCSSGGINVWGSRSPIRSIYVYNPTTNCFAKLPRPGIVKEVPRIVVGVNLAFDLTKFPNYKVVCVRGSEFAPDLYQIEIYSAETGVWTLSGEPFSSSASFNYGVYWNGSIHWISYERKELLYFHVDEERFGKMALPGEGRRRIAYFGESCDHLHIIETQNTEKSFHVYEMKRDYSEWFVKYYVDLTGVAAAFPDTVFYLFYVYSLVRFEQRPFLVLEFGRKTVRFNLDCNTFEEISKLGDIVVKSSFPHAFEYIESLASVGGH